MQEIQRLNEDPAIDGIIVQLPLDTINKIDSDSVIDQIEQSKDVDGLTRINAGRLARGELQGTIMPCTPRGCLHLVQKATGRYGDAFFKTSDGTLLVRKSKVPVPEFFNIESSSIGSYS